MLRSGLTALLLVRGHGSLSFKLLVKGSGKHWLTNAQVGASILHNYYSLNQDNQTYPEPTTLHYEGVCRGGASNTHY